MTKHLIRLGLTLAAVGLWAVPGSLGCFSDSSSNGNSGSMSGSTLNAASGSATGSASGAGATGSGATGAGSASGSSPGAFMTTSSEVVLDDMSGPQSMTGGSWYTYSDRSVPNSEPPIFKGTPPGSVTPTEGDSFTPGVGNGPMINGMIVNARECSGGGETTWGAGFGFDLISGLPDGGAVSINSCSDAGPIFDTNPDASSVGIPQQFNAVAAKYTGFSFYGKSLGAGMQTVEVHLDDKDTSPWGGVCNACQSGGKCVGTGASAVCPCSDNYIKSVIFLPGTWQKFTVHWTDIDLKTSNWSLQGLQKGAFDATTMYNIHFQLTTSAPKALPMFDVAVAYVSWETN